MVSQRHKYCNIIYAFRWFDNKVVNLAAANVTAIDGQGTIKQRKKGEAEKSDIPCPNVVHVSLQL